MALLSGVRCRKTDSCRNRKFLIGALFLVVCLYFLSQQDPGSNTLQWGNRDLLRALGKQGSARDVHGHKFKFIGIDGKWIPVSDTTPESILGVGDSDTQAEAGGDGYRLEKPFKRDFSNGQSLVIDKLLDHQTRGYFLDIGAGDGETKSITLFFERWRQWKGLLLEPDEEKFELIQSKNRKAAAWKMCIQTSNMNHFLGNEPCVSIRYILETLKRDSIELLNINVRGHAYDVIKAIDLTKYKVKVFCVEIDEDEERNAEYNQVTQHLLQWGYHIMHIFIEKHLHKMDVIYMKS